MAVAGEPEAHDYEDGRQLFAQPCHFVVGVTEEDSFPLSDRVEICFAGRSNVGKSTLLNALVGRRGMARVSGTPGRTQQLNYFALGSRHYLVDLPGYGYARAPQAMAAKWQNLLRLYLAGRQGLRRAFVLIDSRRGIGSLDETMFDLFSAAAVSFQCVLTKADKPSRAQVEQTLSQMRARLARRTTAFPELHVTSASHGQGIAALRATIAALR